MRALLVQECWQDEAEQRPAFEDIVTILRAMLHSATAQRQRSQTCIGKQHTDLCSDTRSSLESRLAACH